jgi:hypothetical protein
MGSPFTDIHRHTTTLVLVENSCPSRHRRVAPTKEEEKAREIVKEKL